MFRKKLLLKTKFTLKLAIFVYFQVKRDSPYTCPKTFIISASYRSLVFKTRAWKLRLAHWYIRTVTFTQPSWFIKVGPLFSN